MSASRPPPASQATEPWSLEPAAPARTVRTLRIRDQRTSANPRDQRNPRDRDGPMVLDRYRLHRRLGSGGFGTVWLARDERLERDVAVKLLPRERIVGGRFEREARAAARLSHPGIVTLYEAAVDDDGAYLVSELVVGTTLGELLQAGRLSDRDVVEIGVGLCDALVHAHARGVVHRDVKPSNVLVPDQPSSPARVAKLTDFGVARLVGADTLTRTGDVVGTAAYMAPEQAEGLQVGAPADLYSLALVTYEALSGVNPVLAGTAAQRTRRLGAHLPPIRRQRRELPRELGQAIDLALRPRPRERGSVEELRAGLLSSLRQVDDKPGVVTSPWPSVRPRQRPGPDPAVAPEERPGADGSSADDRPDEPDSTAIRWPARALAAAVTGGLWGWLAGHVLGGTPLAPATAAVVAALAVAASPRLGWLALSGALSAILISQDKAGAALVLLAAALVPVVLLPRRGSRWPLAAVAPALGAIGLAGCWPALAARAPNAWQRAALGITGWVWIVVAAPLAGTGLYARMLPGTPASALWTPSLYETTHHVLWPVLSSGALAPAPVWGAAAVLLPVITRMRPFAVAFVLVVVWAAVLASATTAALAAAHTGVVVNPDAPVLGAAASVVVALLPTALRRGAAERRTGNTRTGLA